MKWVTLVLVAALIGLQHNLWFANGGWHDMWKLEQSAQEQSEANKALQIRNQRLAAEVGDLKNGQDAIAEIARTDLGYVQTGETYYRILPPLTANEAEP